jgi:hypothetical protein
MQDLRAAKSHSRLSPIISCETHLNLKRPFLKVTPLTAAEESMDHAKFGFWNHLQPARLCHF